MKKTKLVALLISLCLLFTACGGGGTQASGDVDIDLTQMGETMMFAQLGAFYGNVGDYEGQTVRLRGFFTTSLDSESGERRFYVNVPDQNLCCQQTVEFAWAGEHQYPDDYPAEGAQLEMVGFFTSIERDGRVCVYMDVDTLEKV